MYNRILKRPMFKRGGSSYEAQGTGITSPYDRPRKRYDVGTTQEDISFKTKSPSGLNIYTFKYKGDDAVYEGVMAQEVPWASIEDNDGYLSVDYSKVDVDFKKLNQLALGAQQGFQLPMQRVQDVANIYGGIAGAMPGSPSQQFQPSPLATGIGGGLSAAYMLGLGRQEKPE